MSATGTGPGGALPGGVLSFGTLPPDLLSATADALVDALLLVEATAGDALSSAAVTYVPLTAGVYAGGTWPASVSPATTTIDLSDRDWTSRATDTRAHVHFEGRAREVTVDRSIPLTPIAPRRVAASVSEIRVDNADGAYDGVTERLAIDGRPVTLKLLQSRASAYADAVTILAGSGLSWRADADALRIVVRDQGWTLDVPLLSVYGGTGGADGGDENKGKAVPQVYGRVRNLSPAAVGTLPIYQVHDRTAQAIDAVYVRGAPVTAGAPRADVATLIATSPTAGTYDWTLTAAGSFFRLGSAADGVVTADVRGDADGGYVNDVGAIVRRIVSRASASVTLDDSSLNSLSGSLPAECGIAITAQTTAAEALTQLCAGTGCWWGDTGSGRIGAARLAPPAGTPGVILDETNIIGEVEPLELPDAVNPTVWRVTVGYRRNWTPTPADGLVTPPTITEERRTELTQAGRTVATADSARTGRNYLAREIALDSLFDAEADATSWASTILATFTTGRGLWRVPVGLAGHQLSLGSELRLVWPRYGLAAGRDVRVIGAAVTGWRVDLLVFG